ncbi:thioredoxin family protein [Maribacter algarum]|uniref:Thioredoxin family protein n=1 Tax=Maribacter algarum (ex Zhang et al. 2020) TaxID=2578118 RepID=A0A5S3PE06_9FLAO|nr:thioredoxin family protein [Maribacter algarum]TMM52212.1 thioredoxin family protein [Maribacter algarum]
MNPFILVLLLATLSTSVSAQQINQEIKIEGNQPYMVGKIDLNGLTSNSYQSWYDTNHKAYEVDTKTLSSIKNELTKHKVLVFMGTWCGDSKREVPRFIKTLEAADFPMENLKIVAVDRRKEHYKKSPTGEEWGLSIKRVPTFIFYKDGKETNRIIESPIVSLEEDIKTIVTGSEYIPNYPKSLHFD